MAEALESVQAPAVDPDPYGFDVEPSKPLVYDTSKHHQSSTPGTPLVQEPPPVATPEGASPEPAINAAGRPYDPATGRLLPETPVEAPAPPAHPAWVMQQAEALGLDEEDLSLPTAAVTKQINRLLWQQQKFRSEQNAAKAVEEATRPAPQTPTAPEPDQFAALEEEVAPSILAQFRKMAAELKALKENVGQVRTFQEQARHESLTQYADRLFSEHGDPAKIGKGSMGGIKPDAKEARIRNSAIAHATLLAGPKATAAQIVQRIPDALAELGLSAPVAATPEVTAPTPAAAPTKPPKKPFITTKQWDEGALRPPSHRNGSSELKGREKAIAALDAKMREEGQHPEQTDDSEIDDTLLG